jgi:hypothetical protein
MSLTLRLHALTGLMIAAFSLATLAPSASHQAEAQGIRARGITNAYYNGYGGGYSGYRFGYGGLGYGRHGSSSFGYTGFGNGPYGYRSNTLFFGPSSGNYGYRGGTSYDLYNREVRPYGGGYRQIYQPNTIRYYSPYGIGGY